MQDPTTHAMTELSLALSMAFFSLLILSLISIGNVSDNDHRSRKELAESAINKTSIIETESSENTSELNKSKVIIYFKQKLFDLDLTEISANYCDPVNGSVLAVQKTDSIADVLRIKELINCPDLSITTLDEKWITRLTNGVGVNRADYDPSKME